VSWEHVTRWKVVCNDEEQYSIWPEDRTNAPGWVDAGKAGTKEECLQYVSEVWTDMRPLSLRRAMAADEQAAEVSEPATVVQDPSDALLQSLTSGDHPVRVGLDPEASFEAFLEAVGRGYVVVEFTDTRGGTRLGFPIDRKTSAIGDSSTKTLSDHLHLEGTLRLNGTAVRCIINLESGSLIGTGRLIRVESDVNASYPRA
jgi:uncharacterized protein YbdZ (MbtH family)